MGTVAFTDRMLRGWAAGFIATLFAAIGHFSVSGTLPALPGIVLALAASGFVCSVFTGRRMGLPRVAAAVLVSQGPYHLLFSTPAAMATGTAAPGHQHHHGHGQPALQVALDGAAGGGTAMWFAHLAAATLTVAAVSRAERFVWMLADLMGTRLVRLFRLLLPVAVTPRPMPASRRKPVALPGRPAGRPIARRGPPSYAAPTRPRASAPALS